MNNGLTSSLWSELTVLLTENGMFEMIRKEWAKVDDAANWDRYLSEAQMRAKRNRFRKSWPELADLLDKATKADVMDGVVKDED